MMYCKDAKVERWKKWFRAWKPSKYRPMSPCAFLRYAPSNRGSDAAGVSLMASTLRLGKGRREEDFTWSSAFRLSSIHHHPVRGEQSRPRRLTLVGTGLEVTGQGSEFESIRALQRVVNSISI